MNASVDFLLSKKEHAIYTVTLDTTVADAVSEMNLRKIGFVMVLSSSKLVGVFSPDYGMVMPLVKLLLLVLSGESRTMIAKEPVELPGLRSGHVALSAALAAAMAAMGSPYA